jgi:hypothetical protein
MALWDLPGTYYTRSWRIRILPRATVSIALQVGEGGLQSFINLPDGKEAGLEPIRKIRIHFFLFKKP